MELEKTYSPEQIETKWYKTWETSGYFKPTFQENAQNYCIQLPPPNVTGTLHMGHGFQHTLMDTLVRYHRMRGYNTLWQAGTDHAGIATQIVVERLLDAEGTSRHNLGRDKFVERVWQWKHESGGAITQQMRRLGTSCDWSREQFTMNDDLSQAVNEVFVSLYEKGYIYRGKRLVNWDIQLQTAVSDLEVISVEENGHMWHIRYPVKDSTQALIVATTRPETMLGDVAVAVNPKDSRYLNLIGKTLLLPLVGREIPIIADDYVDIEFGTGCVKITPAHDFNDYAIGMRHNLEPITIMTLDGKMNTNTPAEYQGIERFAARKKIIADLEAQGYLVETKPHKLMVPRGDRTNVVIEPMLTDQWFMKMDDFAQRGLQTVASGEIKFVPENWQTTYNQWLEKINDWCISRQLWWGHRIPAYYDQNGQVYVARDQVSAITMAGTGALRQDEDVLDTWFSSALWCFATLGWPKQTRELSAFLPSSVLVTGFDIIFFWVARMIMLTQEVTGKIPFQEVYVTGLILDANGQKMSKSKGNTIDPIDLIDGINIDTLVTKRTQNLMNPKQAETIAKSTRKDYPTGFQAFGADALRFTFASLATNSREIRFDVRRIESSRNFCNKLWNATRFVLMNLDNSTTTGNAHTQSITGKIKLNMIDTWIITELQSLITELDFAYKTYRFDIITQKLYEFVWNEFCDWYVELAKVNLASDSNDIRNATATTLLLVLECVLRLLHPVIPFITEELWQVVAPMCGKNTAESIMLAKYPTTDEFTPYFATTTATLHHANIPHSSSTDSNSSSNVTQPIPQLKEWVTGIRNLRAEMNLNPGTKVPLMIEGPAAKLTLQELAPYIMSLAKISQVEYITTLDTALAAPVMLVDSTRIMLQVAIDIDAEKTRISKEIEKNTKELEKIQAKLSTPGFTDRAPKEVVLKETDRAHEFTQALALLNQQLQKLVL